MLSLVLFIFVGTRPARAQGPNDLAGVRAWLAARGLQPGDEVDAHVDRGAFVLRAIDVDRLTFSHPRRGAAPVFPLARLGAKLRADGFVGLRYLLVIDGSRRGELAYVYDLDLGIDYAATNRSLDFLRETTYLRGEMDEDVLRALGGRTLDLGCGERARAVLALRDAGLDAHGVDPGLRHDLRGTFLKAECWARTSFGDRSMRRIFSSNSVFLYVDDEGALARTLDECERLLEPGGRLVLAGTRCEERLNALVKRRSRLEWVESYENTGGFGPTVVLAKP